MIHPVTDNGKQTRKILRIGLFGGTFDPPHWGHLKCASRAADELQLDQLAFVLAFNPPHKLNQPHSPFDLRRKMIELCLPLDRRFRLCSIEKAENLPGTTVETVQRMRQLGYGEDRCHLIWLMGSDALLELESWHQPEVLLDSIEVAVLPRPGYPLDKANVSFLSRVRVLSTPLLDHSASEIRSRKRSLKDSVPEAVAEFIQQNRLYGLRKKN